MEPIRLPFYPRIEHTHRLTPTLSSQVPLEQAINAIFPQNSEENILLRTRRILGKTAHSLSDQQIEMIVGEFQFLANSWLDEFEKEVFKGMTLREVVNEK